MKRFKSKKIKKKKKYIKIIFIFFFFFSYIFVFSYIKTKRLKVNVLDKNINYINFNVIGYINNKAKNIINNPVLLLNIKSNKNNVVTSKKIQKVLKTSNEISSIKDVKPYIYIYNTHQREEYANYDVKKAATLLSDKLNKIETRSVLEENSMKVFLDNNNLKYSKSYEASRNYINEALINYPDLKYFFDIHRDSVSKDKSTISINTINYAKILFVIGSDNPNYENNLKNANYLNSIIENKLPGISRGVITHGGKGYNGIYNQDLSENVFLIEVGGLYNTKEEVENTINILYESIIEYIEGEI